MARTIKIKSYTDVQEEYVAAAAITPGDLLELTSAGEVQKHSTAEGNVLPMFALENELEGEDVNTAYAADDQVQVWIPTRGDIAYAILADGENVAIGDYLESNGAGLLQKHVADVTSHDSNEPGSVTDVASPLVGVALEAINISDSSGGESSGDLGYDKRIKVRII